MKKIFLFWLSLASTSFFMALEIPICTAVISRLKDSEINLAALGIVSSLALFIQSPVLRLTSTPLMFINDSESFYRLQRFAFLFSATISLLFLILTIDPFFNRLIAPFFGFNTEMRLLVQNGLSLWSVFPLLIGLRRFYQGVILLAHEPRKITIATFLRLFTLTSSIFILGYLSQMNGLYIGIIGVGLGMAVEMFASWVFARGQILKLKSIKKAGLGNSLSMSMIIKAFTPLSISTCVAMSGGPIVSFFTARGSYPLESLALVPIIFGLLNPFTWSAFAIQDSTHALIAKDPESYPMVKKFSIIIGISLSVVLFLVSISPLADFYFLKFNHLSEKLYSLVLFPSLFISIIPVTATLKNFYRGNLIAEGRPRFLLLSESLEVITMAVIFFILSHLSKAPGINSAMISLWAGSATNLIFLKWGCTTQASPNGIHHG